MTLQNEFSAKTVLITGHTGFKGAWLTAWLKQLGAKVVGIALNPPTEPSHFDVAVMERIRTLCHQANIPCGMHVVMPDTEALKKKINEGYRFIAYSIDAVFFYTSTLAPKVSDL